MIIDAKRLANRLKEKEALADALTNDTERINYQIESMRQVKILKQNVRHFKKKTNLCNIFFPCYCFV